MNSPTKISGFTIRLPNFLLSSPLLYKITRLFNSLFGKIYLIAISRYSSTLSIFSSFHDSLLYSQDYSNKTISYLNIGSGFFSHPMWTCIDLPAKSTIYAAVQGKINHDFTPANLNDDSLSEIYDSDSFYAIYSSHTLEHLSRNVLRSLFDDVYSILRQNGVFRICVPDLQSFFNVTQALPALDTSVMFFFLKECYTPLYAYLIKLSPQESTKIISNIYLHIKRSSLHESLEYISNLHQSLDPRTNFPPDYHISYPTASFLKQLASDSGFSHSYVTCREMSLSPVFKNKFLFDTTIPDLSLYMEFVK